MENASKALIIAGAILLSILIIGLGMLIFNQAKETIGKANLDQDTVNAANSRFDTYLGDSKRGSSVKDLCTQVKNNNLTANGEDSFEIEITVNGEKATEASDIDKLRAKIGNGKYYNVTCTYDKKKGGLIDTITVEDAKKSGTSTGTVTE
ncbi:MAG: hypothetical protein HFJ41_02450 [Clostridia bacterium]|nr:hypothetical protein [Clostridia bacterium]